jgi:hypothetical protein
MRDQQNIYVHISVFYHTLHFNLLLYQNWKDKNSHFSVHFLIFLGLGVIWDILKIDIK